MAETVNLPRDSTLRELVAVQKASIIASGNTAAIDRLYGSLVRAAKSVEEVNTLFVDWWNICWKECVPSAFFSAATSSAQNCGSLAKSSRLAAASVLGVQTSPTLSSVASPMAL